MNPVSSERQGISIFAFTECGRGRYAYEAGIGGATLSDRHLHSIQQKSLLNASEGLLIVCMQCPSLSIPCTLVCTNFHHGRIWRGSELRCVQLRQERRTQSMPKFVARTLRNIFFTLMCSNSTQFYEYRIDLVRLSYVRLNQAEIAQPHEKVSKLSYK